jgi:hypothetical protein
MFMKFGGGVEWGVGAEFENNLVTKRDITDV